MAEYTFYPVGTRDLNSWVASAGNKEDCVDEAAGSPNDDTDYIYCNTGVSQHFSVSPSLTVTSAIDDLTVYFRHRKTTADASQCQARLRVNWSYYAASAEDNTTSYVTNNAQWSTNPNSTNPWTEAEIEATGGATLQSIGVGSIGVGGVEEVRCTQIYGVVTYDTAGGGISIPVVQHHHLRH